MKKILICCDKFRGSLEANEVNEILKKGFSQTIDCHIVSQILADGGEGTFEILTKSNQGIIHTIEVQNAIGKKQMAQYGFVPSKKTAYIEMAQASGLATLSADERNPLNTNTFGTGQLVLHAIQQGAKHIVLGIGGSATNDAGTGLAAALGYRFLDINGKELMPCGKNLIRIDRIDTLQKIDLQGITFSIACDVENPLYGKNGAAYIYAPQKGAAENAVSLLDDGLQHFAAVVKNQLQQDVAMLKGAGAAGGLGFGAMVFLQGKLCSGIDLVMQETDFEQLVRETDYIITGEGKLDEQTLEGKVIAGVIRLAKKHHKPIIAVCGTLALSARQIQTLGLTYAESIITRPMLLAEAQQNAEELLEDWAVRIGGMIKYLK